MGQKKSLYRVLAEWSVVSGILKKGNIDPI